MSTEEPTKPKAKSSKVTLRPTQWAVAEAMWSKGEATADELAKKFGVNRTTIHRHMTALGIAHGAAAEKTRKAVAEKVEAAIEDEAAIAAARIRETKDEHYKMASGLSKLTWNEILKAKQDGVPFAAVLANVKTLREAAATLAILRNERWVILGQDRPDAVDTSALPDLNINELTAEKIEELRNRDFNPYDDSDLVPDDKTPAARDPHVPEQDEA